MAASLYVTLLGLPPDIDSVRALIENSFQEFSLKLPRVYFEDWQCSDLRECFVFVESQSDEGWGCCISFSDGDLPEITGDARRTCMADISMRGDWAFAALVSYALLDHPEDKVLDDSAMLGNVGEYSAESLRAWLCHRLKMNGLKPP